MACWRPPRGRLTRRRLLVALALALPACGPVPSPTPGPAPTPAASPTAAPARPAPTAASRPAVPAPAVPAAATLPPSQPALASRAGQPTPAPAFPAGPTPTLPPPQVSADVPPLARVAEGVRYGPLPELRYRGELSFWAGAYTPLVPTPARPHPPRYLNRVIAEYRRLRPEIAVRLVSPAEAAVSPGWLKSSVASRSAPDVFWSHSGVLNHDLPQGAVVDLRHWLDRPNPYVPTGQSGSLRWRDLLAPWVLESIAAPSGAIYQINADAVATTLFYNKAAFARVGQREPPRTFRELLDLSARLRLAGYVPTLLGAGTGDYRWSWWAREAATVLYGPRFDELRVEGPRHSLSLLSQVVGYRRGILHPRDPAYGEIWRLYGEWSRYWAPDVLASADFYRDFAQGKAALMWNGTWVVPQLLADPTVRFEWGAFPLPVLTRESSPLAPETRGPALGAAGGPTAGFQYAVSSERASRSVTPDKVEAGVDWLRFLSLPWCVEPLCADLGFYVPTVRGARPRPELAEIGFGLDRPVPVIAPLHEPDAESSALYQSLVQRYLAGRLSAEELAQQLVAHLDPTVERLVRANGWDLSKLGAR